MGPPVPTLEDVQAIFHSWLTRNDLRISSIETMPAHRFSTLTDARSYVVSLDLGENSVERYVLRTSTPDVSTRVYGPNSLANEHQILTLLPTSIPHPTPLKLDVSLSLVPFPYFITSYPDGIPLSGIKNKLSERQRVLLDLKLGTHFKLIHETVQNDWFGLPSQEKDELYSWQEAFTWLLENVLREVELLDEDIDIPHEDVKRYLSRAIGSFLFDDVEVPSLISFTADDSSVLVLPPTGEEDDVQITSLIPVSHALWGDPLLESVFMSEEGPSRGFLEGYGGSPIIFARQRTKRIWYTFFLALVVLAWSARDATSSDADVNGDAEIRSWAKEAVGKCIAKLKDAPCY